MSQDQSLLLQNSESSSSIAECCLTTNEPDIRCSRCHVAIHKKCLNLQDDIPFLCDRCLNSDVKRSSCLFCPFGPGKHLIFYFSHGLWCHSACMLQFYYQCVEQNNNSSKKRKTSKNHSNNFTANELMSILNSTLNDKVFAANFPSIGSYLVNRKNEYFVSEYYFQFKDFLNLFFAFLSPFKINFERIPSELFHIVFKTFLSFIIQTLMELYKSTHSNKEFVVLYDAHLSHTTYTLFSIINDLPCSYCYSSIGLLNPCTKCMDKSHVSHFMCSYFCFSRHLYPPLSTEIQSHKQWCVCAPCEKSFNLRSPTVRVKSTSTENATSTLSTPMSSLQTPMSMILPPTTSGSEDSDDTCDICRDGTSDENDPIVYCSSCNVPLHKNCYGIDVIPEEDWYCEPCRRKLSPSTLHCIICNKTNGAFKPTVDGQWIHSLCVLYTPELYYKYNMSVVDGIDKIDVSRKHIRCTICNETSGSCILCSYNDCFCAYHPMCAARKNYILTYMEKGNNNSIEYITFCKTHSDAFRASSNMGSFLHKAFKISKNSSGEKKSDHKKKKLSSSSSLRSSTKEKEKELEILPKSYTNMPDLWAYYDKVYFKKFSTKEIQENLTQYRRLFENNDPQTGKLNALTFKSDSAFEVPLLGESLLPSPKNVSDAENQGLNSFRSSSSNVPSHTKEMEFRGFNMNDFLEMRTAIDPMIDQDVVSYFHYNNMCTKTSFRLATEADIPWFLRINKVNPLYETPESFHSLFHDKNEFLILAEVENDEGKKIPVGFVHYYFLIYLPNHTKRSVKSIYVCTLQAVKYKTHPEYEEKYHVESEKYTGTVLLSLAFSHGRKAGMSLGCCDSTDNSITFYENVFHMQQYTKLPESHYTPMQLYLENFKFWRLKTKMFDNQEMVASLDCLLVNPSLLPQLYPLQKKNEEKVALPPKTKRPTKSLYMTRSLHKASAQESAEKPVVDSDRIDTTSITITKTPNINVQAPSPATEESDQSLLLSDEAIKRDLETLKTRISIPSSTDISDPISTSAPSVKEEPDVREDLNTNGDSSSTVPYSFQIHYDGKNSDMYNIHVEDKNVQQFYNEICSVRKKEYERCHSCPCIHYDQDTFLTLLLRQSPFIRSKVQLSSSTEQEMLSHLPNPLCLVNHITYGVYNKDAEQTHSLIPLHEDSLDSMDAHHHNSSQKHLSLLIIDELEDLLLQYQKELAEIETKNRISLYQLYLLAEEESLDPNLKEDSNQLFKIYQSYIKKKYPNQEMERDQECYESDAVCDICGEDDSPIDNTIVFCDGCNIALHQSCYNITVIPNGDYFCQVCQHILDNVLKVPQPLPPAPEDPNEVNQERESILKKVHDLNQTIHCAVCGYATGAMLPTLQHSWCHVSCALWLPNNEVEVLAINNDPLIPSKKKYIVDIKMVNERRNKIQCSVCKKRGGCVQCCYNSCARGVHLPCALRSHYEVYFVNQEGYSSIPSYCALEGKEYGLKCAQHSSESIHTRNANMSAMPYCSPIPKPSDNPKKSVDKVKKKKKLVVPEPKVLHSSTATRRQMKAVYLRTIDELSNSSEFIQQFTNDMNDLKGSTQSYITTFTHKKVRERLQNPEKNTLSSTKEKKETKKAMALQLNDTYPMSLPGLIPFVNSTLDTQVKSLIAWFSNHPVAYYFSSTSMNMVRQISVQIQQHLLPSSDIVRLYHSDYYSIDSIKEASQQGKSFKVDRIIALYRRFFLCVLPYVYPPHNKTDLDCSKKIYDAALELTYKQYARSLHKEDKSDYKLTQYIESLKEDQNRVQRNELPISMCICQLQEENYHGEFMMECEVCHNWYHPECLSWQLCDEHTNITCVKVLDKHCTLNKFICPRCITKENCAELFSNHKYGSFMNNYKEEDEQNEAVIKTEETKSPEVVNIEEGNSNVSYKNIDVKDVRNTLISDHLKGDELTIDLTKNYGQTDDTAITIDVENEQGRFEDQRLELLVENIASTQNSQEILDHYEHIQQVDQIENSSVPESLDVPPTKSRKRRARSLSVSSENEEAGGQKRKRRQRNRSGSSHEDGKEKKESKTSESEFEDESTDTKSSYTELYTDDSSSSQEISRGARSRPRARSTTKRVTTKNSKEIKKEDSKKQTKKGSSSSKTTGRKVRSGSVSSVSSVSSASSRKRSNSVASTKSEDKKRSGSRRNSTGESHPLTASQQSYVKTKQEKEEEHNFLFNGSSKKKQPRGRSISKEKSNPPSASKTKKASSSLASKKEKSKPAKAPKRVATKKATASSRPIEQFFTEASSKKSKSKK